MRVLAFDTATPATTVALIDDAAGMPLALEARDDPVPGTRPGHARVLLPLIEQLLSRDGGGWGRVDRIAVGVGPGTFTGLRIGIATAHALARARDLELVGVSTLASLALGGRDAPDAGPQAGILALLDARRGEAFAAAWAPGADPGRDAPALAPAVLDPDGLPGTVAVVLGGASAVAVGDGAIKFREILARCGVDVPADGSAVHRVSARYHAQLATRLTPGAADAVLPAYLRLPDAEIARRG